MKKLVCILISCVFLLTACGSDFTSYKNGNKVEYEQIGLFELNDWNDNIEYELVIGNVVWSVIFIETIIVPVILIGWYLYEPVGYEIPTQ